LPFPEVGAPGPVAERRPRRRLHRGWVRLLVKDALLGQPGETRLPSGQVIWCYKLDTDRDIKAATDGYLLGTPANLGYMSGALKHFLDQIS
jgi:hypothetical protein